MTLEVLKALVVILEFLQELFNGPVLLENAM